MEKEKNDTELELLQPPVSDLLNRINEYTCGTCGKVCFQSDFLNKHYRIRDNRLQLRYSKFFLYDGPIENICTCVNLKPYECEVCHKSFAKSGQLKTHCRVHMAEKPYQCQICNRSFRRRGHMEKHVITHSKERPYRCRLCTECFGNAALYMKHCNAHAKNKI